MVSIHCCSEFNKSFSILSILSKKFTEKFSDKVNYELLKNSIESAKLEIEQDINLFL